MSSFLDRMRAKMSGSLGKVAAHLNPNDPAKEKSRSAIVTNRWDERVWADMRKQELVDGLIYDLTIGDEHTGGTRKPFEAAPELIHDLAMTLYKASPQLLDRREVANDVYVVHKLIKELMDNPRLQELQDLTANKQMETLIGLSAMGDTVREFIGRVPPPPPPPQPKPPKPPKPPEDEKKEDEEEKEPGTEGGNPGGTPVQTQEGGEEGDEGGEGGVPVGPGDGDPEDGDGEPDDIDPGDPQDFEDFEDDDPETDWQNQVDQLLDDLDIDRAMNKALNDAQDEVDELERTRKGIGLDDGEWQQMSPEARLAMAERLRTPEMKMLSEVIGRMKRFALGVKATRVNDVPHEAYDVETGNDIRRVLRSEFALLATRETSYEFYRRFTDRELLQYKMRGKEEVGKGPIVICIDKSGSMNGAPFNWAMGVAEALRRFAAEEDRDYFALFFGSNNDRNRFDFPGGKGPFEKVLTFLSVLANGGTQFDGVLSEALQKASTAFDGDAKGKADIVFITDGYANLSDEWIAQFNAERNRVGVRVYSVYVGGAYDMGHRNGPQELLTKISDAVIPVRELRPEAVKAIFEKV